VNICGKGRVIDEKEVPYLGDCVGGLDVFDGRKRRLAC
jgi:hypothetical protein